MSNLFKALNSWDEGLARLGECIVQFQRIEETLNICISAMIGNSRKIGEIVTCEMSFRAKLSVFSALFLHTLKQADLPEDIVQLTKDLDWAAQRRNALVHSLWDLSEIQPETIRREKPAIRQRHFRIDQENLTSDEIDDIGRKFEKISEDLIYLTSSYFPKLEKRLNH